MQLQQSTAVRGERHGLSAQIGAVHAVLKANAAELSLENYLFRCAITWHAWHVRWRSVDLASAGEQEVVLHGTTTSYEGEPGPVLE